MVDQLRHGTFLVLEKLLRWCVHPKLRARLLAMLGAYVGSNVRIHECQFINLSKGFSNLRIEDDVFIGAGCLIDLEGGVVLERGATLSPRVQVITHRDPGSYHQSPLAVTYPKEAYLTRVGQYAWIGAGATIISGAEIGEFAVVGAMSMVNRPVEARSIYVGVPAKKLGGIDLP